ncbi:glycosyltransferase family 2 protein [Alteromonas facilis]|uniref:glycosyltransferase family 2 protein n=1 Tax=Alteromonas facilis TaxID=2048004 RepID=UPI000C28A121|nr:glycosyltransferase family 2 protein [Alteromonas facilis]
MTQLATNPTISIVVPFYNGKQCLERLFVSLADYKERQDIEMIIVDDCSSAEHAQALDDMATTLSWTGLHIVHCDENGGAAKARKVGIQQAKGEYIAFLDSDDAWALHKLDAQLAAMKQYEAVISGCACEQIEENQLAQARAKAVTHYDIEHFSSIQALFKNPFSTPTVMMTKAVALEHPFSDTLRYSEDVDCWRRILLQYGGIVLKGPNAFMFKHAFLSDQGSLSSFTIKMSLGQLSSLSALLFNAQVKLRYRALVPFALVWASIKALRREWLVLRRKR